MKKLLLILALFAAVPRAHALTWEDSGSSSSGGGGTGDITGVAVTAPATGGGTSGDVTIGVSNVRPGDMKSGACPDGQVLVSSSTANDWVCSPLVTDYTEPIIVSPEWGKSTANTFDSAASTNPTFGKIKFDATASKTTNCAYAVLDNFRNFTATTSVNITAVRIDQFRVISGSATDASGQTYIVSVASVADNVAVSSLVFTSSQTITVSAGSGTFKQRWQNATITASGWGPVFDVGAPVAFEICRDGTDASAIDSYGGVMTLRLATTSP